VKNVGRRMVAGILGSAPLTAPMAGKVAAEGLGRYPTPSHPAMNYIGDVGQSIQSAPMPPGVRDFQNARRGIEHIHRQRYEIMNMSLFDQNIASLRSVSPQHKIRMQYENMQRLSREQESLIDALARKFDVWEWWKGKDAPERY
jgi:hypothetical protein